MCELVLVQFYDKINFIENATCKILISLPHSKVNTILIELLNNQIPFIENISLFAVLNVYDNFHPNGS